MFFVTFGNKYRREPHPRLPAVHPDGWVAIDAPNMAAAREIAFENLGVFWADIYDAEDFRPEYFPRGELVRFGPGILDAARTVLEDTAGVVGLDDEGW